MIEGVNIGHALLAGFVAGYAMTIAGFWLEGVFGFPRMDFGMTGMKYVGADKPGWWFVGHISHSVNSMALALVYAAAVFLNLEDIFSNPIEWWWGPFAGLAYGFVVFLVLPMGIMGAIMSLTGQRLPMDAKFLFLNLVLHLLYGVVLGALYFPVR